MPAWVTCTHCGKIQEIDVTGQLPDGWRRDGDNLWCPACADANDVIEETVDVNVDAIDLDDADLVDYCEVCKGPCQGH